MTFYCVYCVCVSSTLCVPRMMKGALQMKWFIDFLLVGWIFVLFYLFSFWIISTYFPLFCVCYSQEIALKGMLSCFRLDPLLSKIEVPIILLNLKSSRCCGFNFAYINTLQKCKNVQIYYANPKRKKSFYWKLSKFKIPVSICSYVKLKVVWPFFI